MHNFSKLALVQFSLATALVGFIYPVNTFAKPINRKDDSLTPVETAVSKTAKKTRAREVKELYAGKWLEPGTNFTAIFINGKGPLKLLDWIGSVFEDITPGPENLLRSEEFVGAEKVFKDSHFNELHVTILVPHPKFKSVVELGLLPAFSKFEPPALRLDSTEDITISHSLGSKLYVHEDGSCSIVIKLPKSSMINVGVKSCGNKDSLAYLAKKLDVERLSMKLQS